MDRYDRHTNRGGDRYNLSNNAEESHHYNNNTSTNRRGFSSSRFSDSPDAPFNHNRHENHRGGGRGGDGVHSGSPRVYRSGSGSRDHYRPFDSPPRYPPRGGGERLRPIVDEIGGFPPAFGGEVGYPPMGDVGTLRNVDGGGFRGMDDDRRIRPMGGGSDDGGFRGMGDGGGFPVGGYGRGFRPMGCSGDVGGFRPMGGSGDVGGFRPMGGSGDVGGFRPMGGSGDGGGFRPMGGSSDGGGFRPMGGSSDGGGFRPMGGSSDGGGFRPMGGSSDGGGFGSENYRMPPPPPPVTGQKRGYPFAEREKSPDRLDGAGFAKLFVGSVPRTATEEDIQPLFDRHGHVLEVALIKDKRTGQQQGCCFIKYASSEEAERAIKGLHNKCTLPGGVAPIQVRYADGERERLGATEYKLFVGALNKQATETEIEEIFSCYGRVEDIYLMRDELKQSRGCAFVKYSKLEMAHAAINALNGIYTMRGCNQPLTVRFADNKRSRLGDSRVGPAFANDGFGPQPSAPGIRPAQNNIIEPLRGPIPPYPWPPVSPQNLRPPSNVHTFNSQLQARSGVTPTSNIPGPVNGVPSNPDGSHPGSTVSSAPIAQKYNQSLPQAPPSGLHQSPSQRPLTSPPNAASFSNMQGLQGPHLQPGQVQMPYSEGRNPYFQTPPSQQLPGPNGQLPVTQPQRQHNTIPGPGQQAAAANQQQPPVQELHQPPSQLAQMVSQQKQTLQATFQSSQQTFNQLQQQMQQLQPSNQNRIAHQGPQSSNQQAPWAGIASQAATSTTAASAPPAVTPNCNWSEHLSPQGYKYYYNDVTGESKWEKPEELKAYEQQQQQQKPSNQYNHAEHRPQGLSTNQATPQTQVPFQGQHHVQFQNQIRPFQQPSQSSFQAPGLSEKQDTNKELGYAQIPAGNATMNNPARYQQASQEWMWKNKPSGT